MKADLFHNGEIYKHQFSHQVLQNNKLAKLSRCVSRVHFENYTLQSKSESCWASSFQKIYDITWSTKVLEILRHQNTLKRTLFSQFQSMQQERNCEKVNFNVCPVIYHRDFNFNVRHRSSRYSILKVRARPKVQPNITREASRVHHQSSFILPKKFRKV